MTRKSGKQGPRRKRAAVKSPPACMGPVNEWFELRRSAIQGFGGFAIRDIPKGTRIIEYAGERISNAEADRRDAAARAKRHHTFLFILNRQTV
ncbi:MAG TPA: SET domain-containing protein-lysine N-methyltransferase, partial [Gemmatimonadaceae bacterium]|nr:SET domain-containing protein-lysine N-methyltransferase [Gemmatimonadaceae bacterium]